ncbi:MAG: rane protein of unknown function [Candidatus Binatus sp.]|nr:rane protein of unknown function [Candidatus Binatus sp.]
MWLLRPGCDWAQNPDSPIYWALARGIQHGCFAPYESGCGPPEIFRTPGYPAFLIPFSSNCRAVIVVQALIGAFVCLLVARYVAHRCGPAAAMLAAAIVAFDVPSILLSKEIMAEALFQGVATAAMVVALNGEKERNRDGGLVRAAFVGLMIGAAALVRPVGLVLIPIVALAVGFRQSWRGAAVALAISITIVGGWALRNYEQTGRFTVTIEESWNFYWYTAPAVLERHDHISREAARDPLSAELEAAWSAEYRDSPTGVHPRPESDPALSRFMFSRAIAIILAHPIDSAIIFVRGFLKLAFEPYFVESGWHGLVAESRALSAFRVFIFCFDGVMVAILWIGSLLALRDSPRDPERWLLLFAAILLILPASPIVGALSRRFRSPAIPFLAMLAAYGWTSAGARFLRLPNRLSRSLPESSDEMLAKS